MSGFSETRNLNLTPGAFSSALPKGFCQWSRAEKFLRAAELFCFRFDPGSDDHCIDIFFSDWQRVHLGKLVDCLAYRCRIAKNSFLDHRGGDFLLVALEKIETAFHPAQ